MRTLIVSGSHRKESNSFKVAQFLAQKLQALKLDPNPDILNMADGPLPLWDDEMWVEGSALTKHWQPFSERLHRATALVIIAPEWAGMVPPALKNFFVFCSSKEIGHKPGLICTVSTGMGGSYPAAELRMSSYKNSKICYIPENLVIRAVSDFLAGESKIAKDMHHRAEYALTLLNAYSNALELVRRDDITRISEFPNGL